MTMGKTFGSLGERCQPKLGCHRGSCLKMILSFSLSSPSPLRAQALLWPLLEGDLMSPSPPPHSAPRRTVPVCAKFLPHSDLFLHLGINGDVVSQGGEGTRSPRKGWRNGEVDGAFRDKGTPHLVVSQFFPVHPRQRQNPYL